MHVSHETLRELNIPYALVKLFGSSSLSESDGI